MTATEPSTTDTLRRDFASAWGRMGSAWGVAPSTAAVQGYLLVLGGPHTESEMSRALGLSHRATRVALAECEAWGIIERAPGLRRSGQRGPAGTAWVAVLDHWEWFGRVISARKAREGDPVVGLLEQYRAQAAAVRGDPETRALADRLGSLLEFVGRFDHALAAFARADTDALRRLFDVLDRLDDTALDRLFAALPHIPAADLAAAATTLAGLSPRGLGNLVSLAARPGVGRVVRVIAGGGSSR